MLTLDTIKKGFKDINDLVNLADVRVMVKELEVANEKILELENQVKELELQVNNENNLKKNGELFIVMEKVDNIVLDAMKGYRKENADIVR